jgi:zinc transporter, ZIP family
MSLITRSNLQFFAGVLFFGFIVKFIPEPAFSPQADPSEKKVGMNCP